MALQVAEQYQLWSSAPTLTFRGQQQVSGMVLGDPGGVLVVEDEVIIAALLKTVLENAGIQVAGVANAAEDALSLAETVQPVVAVVDIRLGPGPDGVYVAERLREKYRCAVVFVSGSGDRETMERVAQVDGAVFLHKPVKPTALIDHVRGMLAAG